METAYLMQGYYMRDMQLSTLVAAFINANRDPKRSSAAKAEDISVFRRGRDVQTPEQQRAILEGITIALGGTVTHD
ncbi:MAG TPA: hypothetical protein VLH56_16805 [Dissulfurispiraceae bacterium]|nr:hypothetical protein [Dissulfurispiraceae bacterium]